MAREYNPSKIPTAEIKFTKDSRKVGDRKVMIYKATCKLCKHVEAGDTESEVALHIGVHVSRKHRGYQIRKA